MFDKAKPILGCNLAAIIIAFAPLHNVYAQNHALTDAGMKLYQSAQYKEALVKFIAAYGSNEDPALDCFQQAMCYYKLGDQARSMQMLRFVVDNFGTSPVAKSANQWISSTSLWKAGVATPSATVAASAPSGELPANIPSSIDVPYLVDGHGLIIVRVLINGKVIPCYYDTGAEVSLFTTSQLARSGIQLDTDAGVKAKLIGIGGETQARRVVVDMQLGALRRKVRIFVQDDTALIRNQGSSAVFGFPLIGEDFYGDLAYTINDDAHVLTFYPAGIKGRDSDAVPYSQEGRLIVVKPKVNGREVEMILDTGAASLSFSDLQISAMGMSRPTDAGHGSAVGLGGRRENYSFPLDSVSLGAVTKRDVAASCTIHSSGMKPLLGRSFMQGLKITVDPKAKQVRISE